MGEIFALRLTENHEEFCTHTIPLLAAGRTPSYICGELRIAQFSTRNRDTARFRVHAQRPCNERRVE
jgi:hypothetical protein